MDLFSFLATIIVITSVVTLIVALAAYVAYKIRDARKPSRSKRAAEHTEQVPIFLKPSVTEAMLSDLTEERRTGRGGHGAE
jgi:hypothetical protein